MGKMKKGGQREGGRFSGRGRMDAFPIPTEISAINNEP